MRLNLRGTGRHRGVTGFAVGVVATMTIAGGGVALASIPSSSTAKFTGCVAKQGGALRVIDAQAGKKCKSSEKKITWSKGWTHRGAWASGTTYKPGDVVTQSGSSYVAKSKSTGVSPGSDASKWGLLAAAGATGAAGTNGATGARGPSDAFAALGGGIVAWGTAPTFATVRTLSLPAGSFVVTATGLGNNNGGVVADVDCQLLLGGVVIDDLNSLTPGAQGAEGERMTVAMTGAGTLAAPGSAEFSCRSDQAGNVLDPSIVAIQVASATIS